ncbi:MAG: hypothetical protein DWQ36_23450 [Acidobacteria bacterium]|nr:MAG: hypothetical protein DWQ30_21745 [Acidobacteriota bacterium]REK00115.1 MAG: hypothetical protein DWQ36_23450 [Acidobacteriota bacterium]
MLLASLLGAALGVVLLVAGAAPPVPAASRPPSATGEPAVVTGASIVATARKAPQPSAAALAGGTDDALLGDPVAARLAAGLLPLHVLSLPAAGRQDAPAALLFATEDNQLVRILPGDPSREIATGGGELTALPGEIYVAIGKAGADKVREGDEKTPIGVYWVRDFIPGSRLPEIYGEGAYPISYPNLWDRRLGRTGSGIWIHGTDKADDELLPRSSRGCLTLRNRDFRALDPLVEIGRTPVVIAHDLQWVSRSEFVRVRDDLLGAVERWRLDWESLDTDAYLAHYGEDFRAEGMNLATWSTHKRRVNAHKREIRVALDELAAFKYPGEDDLFLVTFRQDYRSDNYDSTRHKSQFWRRGAEGWRIVQEGGV